MKSTTIETAIGVIAAAMILLGATRVFSDEYLIATIDQRAKAESLKTFQKDLKILINDATEIDVSKLPIWQIAASPKDFVWVVAVNAGNLPKRGKVVTSIKTEVVKAPAPFESKVTETEYIQWFYGSDIEQALVKVGLKKYPTVSEEEPE